MSKNERSANFSLSFINETLFGLDEIKSQINHYLYEATEYYFLDFLDANKKDGMIEIIDDEIELLKAERRYLDFFEDLYDHHKQNCYIVSDLIKDITGSNNYERSIFALDLLDRQNRFLLMATLLYNKSKQASEVITLVNQRDLLGLFVSLAYRNNSFIDAIIFNENNLIFIPNTTYGFGIICNDKNMLEGIINIAKNNGLYLNRLRDKRAG